MIYICFTYLGENLIDKHVLKEQELKEKKENDKKKFLTAKERLFSTAKDAVPVWDVFKPFRRITTGDYGSVKPTTHL